MSGGEPWEDFPELWKTKGKFLEYVRGGIRKGLWEKSPIKMQFLKRSRKKLPVGEITKNYPEGRVVWGCVCAICKGEFKQSEIQVDHIVGEHQLKEIADIQGYTEAIAFVGKGDLQIVCIPCHKIKTHAERMGISFEEAKLEKRVIAWCKEVDVTWQKHSLIEVGFTEEEVSNAKKRRLAYTEYLKKGVVE